MVSRQNLTGLVSRMEQAGHIEIRQDSRDRRSRLVSMTPTGRTVWQEEAIPRIHDYYERVLNDFSLGDMTHTLHYLLKLLGNMSELDTEQQAEDN